MCTTGTSIASPIWSATLRIVFVQSTTGSAPAVTCRDMRMRLGGEHFAGLLPTTANWCATAALPNGLTPVVRPTPTRRR